jgi:hypothetical protein
LLYAKTPNFKPKDTHSETQKIKKKEETKAKPIRTPNQSPRSLTLTPH